MFMYLMDTGAEFAAARMNSQLYVANIDCTNSSVSRPPSRHGTFCAFAASSIGTGP